MYLNQARIATSKLVNAFILVGLAFPSFFQIIFIVYAFTSTANVTWTGRFFFGSFFAIGLAGGIGIMVWRINALRKLGRCRIYNSLLEEDHDGIITYDTLSSMTGLSQAEVIKDLMWFTRNNFMRNVTLGRTAIRVDLLSNEKEFITVSCPCCGAHVNIRKNGGGRCEHCGTFMRAKEDQNVHQ